ncbi:AraC family transcriptional regulator [Caproiciproducens galactitolivorans]|uniref:AraC family transcriptional regulator n=1 Tax=Caproiciproducens galactitolivorans TaxID=642589 RepID=A0ABT4BTE0_9FIRM|nr:AraC family transcriptional regulator [Caproiciproducens galactitolivorans]MCY1714171.1 AraC family transcriptional regulator [Caproiciproducens galactitolivorans]
MDWIQGMQNAINYMELHLLEPFNFDEIAKAAGSSTFHFMRMFNMLTGFTVGEYIRNRRLTLAGQELSLSDAKVVDIAFKYGYETHESFTKAFRQFHGISPSAARKPEANLKSIGKLSIQVTLKGDKTLNYKLIEKEAFTVVGKKTPVTCVNGENFKIVADFCRQCDEDGICDLLEGLCTDEMGVMGICGTMKNDAFDYYMAVTYQGGKIPEGMETLEIPKSTWAVFESVGPIPEAIQDVWKRIFSEWFPSNQYEHAVGPEIEVYEKGDMSKPDYKSYVWIPVTRKVQ